MKQNPSRQRIDKKFEQIGFGGMDEKSVLKRLRNRAEKAFEEIIDLYSAYGLYAYFSYRQANKYVLMYVLLGLKIEYISSVRKHSLKYCLISDCVFYCSAGGIYSNKSAIEQFIV